MSVSRNIIRVLSDTVETLSTAISGERLQEYVDTLVSSIDDVLDRRNTSKIENPLRNYNTYNYVITLGCIEKDSYNYKRFVDSGLDSIILRSGGSKSASRDRTIEEDSRDEDLEYFIDDLEIDAVVAPNPNTSVSLGTTIRFKVTEPYSMGQFLEALQASAKQCNYDNYINASFCLKIEFAGWDEFGKKLITPVEKPIYIPIKMLNMDFNITANGSEYQISAIVFNEAATYNTINNTLVQIGTSGYTVADALENSVNSVTATMNDHLVQLEKEKRIPTSHRYLILFPNSPNSISDFLAESVGADEQIQSQLTNILESEGISDQGIKSITEDFEGAPSIYKKLKFFSLFQENINEIGKSPLKQNFNEGSDQTFTPATKAIQNGLVYRSSSEADPSQESRRFNYTENTRITGIIEDIVMSSKYVQDARVLIDSKQPIDGKYLWFRIEPITFVEATGPIEMKSGNTVNTYVYAVHPYRVDEAKLMGPDGTPSGTDDLRNNAVKTYDYFYTGQNEDILNFDINFNMAFFNAIGGDLGQARGPNSSQITGIVDTPSNQVTERVTNNQRVIEASPQIVVTNDKSITPRGSRDGIISESERRKAENLHNRIVNSTVDMITADMEIWGDPYFIPNNSGTRIAEETSNLRINADGTMTYIRDEVTVVINFKTPLDYQINGFVMNFPELVQPFSGVFNVWAVTNVFAAGKFTQTLKLIRRQGQSNDTGQRSVTSSGIEPDTTDEARAARTNASITPSNTGNNADFVPGATRTGEAGDGLRGSRSSSAAIDPESAAQSFDAKAEATRIRNPNLRGRGL